jgi:hypothetical protein
MSVIKYATVFAVGNLFMLLLMSYLATKNCVEVYPLGQAEMLCPYPQEKQ